MQSVPCTKYIASISTAIFKKRSSDELAHCKDSDAMIPKPMYPWFKKQDHSYVTSLLLALSIALISTEISIRVNALPP